MKKENKLGLFSSKIRDTGDYSGLSYPNKTKKKDKNIYILVLQSFKERLQWRLRTTK